jgi:hypothetical protein
MTTVDLMNPRADDVTVAADRLYIFLPGGHLLSIPLDWFPRLHQATPAQRRNWRLQVDGLGIHWEDIDEDVCVNHLLGLPC